MQDKPLCLYILKRTRKKLDEVVVTALGMKRDKKALGYAMQELKGDELLSSREPNLANSLSGKVSGLQIVRSSNGVGRFFEDRAPW